MSNSQPRADETLLRESHRLLRATNALPPTGAGTAAWASPDGEGLLIADLYPLGPFGDGRVVIHRASAVPPHLASAAQAHATVHGLRPDVGATILARPTHLAAWALAHRALPIRYSPILRASEAPEIPVTATGLRGGTTALAWTLTAYHDIKAVIIADHGALVLGRDLAAATRLLIALEETAELTLAAEALGGPQPFPDDAAARTARGIAGAGL
jgi:ribulose-5-phosphate 4-epimerase/fuculose-1-phosphate aldolase